MNTMNIWSIIEEMDWNNVSRVRRGYEKAKLEFMRKYDEDTARRVDEFVREKYKHLYRVVDSYEGEHGRVGNYGGDDSFSDMLNHVIGLGEAYYNAVCENPELLNELEFVESFSYAIPHTSETMNDYVKLHHAYHRDNARKAIGYINGFMERVDEDDVSKNDAATLREIRRRMTALRDGDIEEAIKDFDEEMYDRFYRFDANEHCALYSNILSDVKKYLLD